MPSPAPYAQVQPQQVPLAIVGGTHFGRYNKISLEETWNFIVSDGFLVPYAGYKNVLTLATATDGRGLYSSFVGNLMIAVIGVAVYKIQALPNGTLVSTIVGTLATNSGDVYIAENNNSQICITDNAFVYVYSYAGAGSFRSSDPSTGSSFSFPFTSPGYISFQNGNLIIACSDSTNWVLSAPNDATTWPNDPAHVGSIQTKPDKCQACVPVPGGGNNLFVFGRNCMELWQFTGTALFPYQRASTFNIDYGCINPASIAHLKNYVVWIAVNEQSGPVLMVSYGGVPEAISTDGIDFQLGNLTNPENCTGFLYQQDGHVLYQFTFPTDNISYAYDFETKLFFNVSDENLNYHPAREVVYFNNNYFFVSLEGGNVYEFSSNFTTAQYDEDTIKVIPRIRICPPLRLPDQLYYTITSLGFTVENGQPNRMYNTMLTLGAGSDITTEDGSLLSTESGVDLITEFSTTSIVGTSLTEEINLAVSRNGGMTFGSFWTKYMNPTGGFKSRFIYQRLGIANDSTFQLRFNGYGRFVVTDGLVDIYR